MIELTLIGCKVSAVVIDEKIGFSFKETDSLRVTMKRIAMCAVIICFALISVPAQSLLTDGKIPKDLVITLERTVCYGTCPDYSLTISANGRVRFRGGQFTKIKGTRSGRITRKNLKRLIAEFEKADFFKFPDKIENSEFCERYLTDLPSEIISIRINGRNKKVDHYFGCWAKEAEKELKPLETLGKMIDEITRSKRWIRK